MSFWQLDTLDHLRDALPDCRIEPYGSTLTPELLDGWSDVDARVIGRIERPIQDVLGAQIWAATESRTKEGHQLLRLVLEDGRRLDLTIAGPPVSLPELASDAAQRFDAALAAVRFGRGSDLIGLHLTLGILREAIVQPMILADRAEGTRHHRRRTAFDSRAAQVAELLGTPMGPGTALAAYRLHGAWQAEVVAGFAPAPEALERVIALGEAP